MEQIEEERDKLPSLSTARDTDVPPSHGGWCVCFRKLFYFFLTVFFKCCLDWGLDEWQKKKQMIASMFLGLGKHSAEIKKKTENSMLA